MSVIRLAPESSTYMVERAGGYLFLVGLWAFGWFFLVIQHKARLPPRSASRSVPASTLNAIVQARVTPSLW